MIFISLKIIGHENLKNLPNNIILTPNHTSELDTFLVPTCLPFWSRFIPMFYVSHDKKAYNDDLFRRIFFGGIFFKLGGGYPYNPGLSNYGKALTSHIQILKDGRPLCVFPEGRMSQSGEIKKFKGGASFLSSHTNSVIVPVKIKGTHGTTFKSFLLRRHKVSLTFSKPIYPQEFFPKGADLSIDDYKKFSDKIREEVIRL